LVGNSEFASLQMTCTGGIGRSTLLQKLQGSSRRYQNLMENGQKTVSSLFDGRKVFNIPPYQRAFAWGDRQLQDFIDDIENQDLAKDYFLGTILFQEKGKIDNFEVIDIVDGQQRITTLIIFMKLLLDKLKAHGDDVAILEETYIEYRKECKLRVLPQDNDFFKSYILQDSNITEDIIRTPSQRRLLGAKNYLRQQLTTYSLETLREFKDKIERTKILTYSVVDNAEATLIFETTNDRGKSLTNLEKTKSFLMYKTYLASDNPEIHLDTIQSRFSDIYRDHEVIEEKIGEDSILQYHFIAFEEWTISRGNKEYQRYVPMVKQKINHLVNAQNTSGAIAYIDKYSRELRETFAIVQSLILSSDNHLIDIFALGRPANVYPLLIKTYKLDQSESKTNFKKVAKLVEIISFRVFGIRRRRTDAGIDKLYTLARDFRGNFGNLISQLKDMIGEYCNNTDFRNRLLSPSFYYDIASNDQNYLFWKYENHLRKTEQPIFAEMSYQEFSSRDKKTRLSIEHIAPQNPKEAKVVADTSVLPRMSKDFEEKYLDSIGNLTIDPLSANISKSNSGFAVKDQKYFRKAPLKTQNELSTFLNPETNKWAANSIEKRRDKILQFALSYWDYKNL
jgi:hypothetical protein